MTWNDTERDDFYKRLAVLAETIGEPMTPVRMAGYAEALADVPLAPVANALRQAAKTCRFFPKPVEIRDLAEPEWRRMREAEWAEHDRQTRQLFEPQMTREETQAAIVKLKSALKGLVAVKSMK